MGGWGYDGGLGLARARPAVRRWTALRRCGCWPVSYGRVVFTLNALPAIRPVNHLVDEDRIIIRTRLTTSISAAVQSTATGVIVAYEADSLDPERHTGWSVVVTGRARTITDPDHIARYEQLLHPWVNHADTVLAIESDIVTGFRIQSA